MFVASRPSTRSRLNCAGIGCCGNQLHSGGHGIDFPGWNCFCIWNWSWVSKVVFLFNDESNLRLPPWVLRNHSPERRACDASVHNHLIHDCMSKSARESSLIRQIDSPDPPPAEPPMIVTLEGSPPKERIFLCTHSREDR